MCCLARQTGWVELGRDAALDCGPGRASRAVPTAHPPHCPPHCPPPQDLSWSDDGLYMCTVSDGAVYTWQLEGFRRWAGGAGPGAALPARLCLTLDGIHSVMYELTTQLKNVENKIKHFY